MQREESKAKRRKMISITREMEKHVAENMGHVGPSNHIESYYWIAVAEIERQNEAINLNRRDPTEKT